jgi:hypothetical protein
LDEFDIILSPNTIIQPFAVMIKVFYTSVAFVAMKRFMADASLTQVTKIFVLFRLKVRSGWVLNLS